ncbi:MAG: hypothetical protein WA947_17720 [Phormidesmis sp.]
MRKLAVQLMSAGLVLGLGVAPAMAQLGGGDTGRANTAEDFKSQDSSDGFLGSGANIWDIYHQSGALQGAGQVDEGFYRSQSRRINRQAESLRARQRAILEQQAAEVNNPAAQSGITEFSE